MNSLKILLVLAVFSITSTGAYLYLGIYNFSADEPHFEITEELIAVARDRSIKARAYKLEVPDDLEDKERIRRGAGNYDAMCVGCHLKPGVDDSEIRKGLYPQPPNLAKHANDPAQQFWVIKHGIKMTGMPAWAQGGMDDAAIWDIVALLQVMPDMTVEQYTELVAISDGHSHADQSHHEQHDTHETAPSGHANEHHDEKPDGSAAAATIDDHPHAPGSKPHAH